MRNCNFLISAHSVGFCGLFLFHHCFGYSLSKTYVIESVVVRCDICDIARITDFT